jgi:hypothetical protein
MPLAQGDQHRALDRRMRRVLDLNPVATARAVAAIAPLGDDSLQPHHAGLPEHDRAVRVGDVLRLFLSRVCDQHHIGGAGNLPRCVPGGDFKEVSLPHVDNAG